MKVLGRFNPLDFFCLLIVILAGAGFFLAKADCAGVDQAIAGKAVVNIDVYFSGLKTEDPDTIFKVGDKSAMTIRNQPVEPAMTISKVAHNPKKSAFVSSSGKVFAEVDPSQPLAHDFVVTLSDQAEISKDGYVVHGQKIKVGNPIELESFSYRVQGVVVGIKKAQ